MKKSLLYTFLILIVLTIITALYSQNVSSVSKISALVILGVFAIKFLLVAFQFMELKKAHVIWKLALTFLLSVIVVVIILI